MPAMRIFSAAVLCAFAVAGAGAVYNPPEIAWKKRIDQLDTGYEQIKINKAVGIDGKILCAGSSRKNGDTATDAYFVLLDSLGNFIRSASTGGAGNEYVSVLYPLPEGGYLAAAASWFADTAATATPNADLWLMKMDMEFKVLESRIIVRDGDNIPTCIAAYGESGFAVGTTKGVYIVDSTFAAVKDTAMSPVTDIAVESGGTLRCTGIAPFRNPNGLPVNSLWLYQLDKDLKTVWSAGIRHFSSEYPDWSFDLEYSSFFLRDGTAICVGEDRLSISDGWFATAAGVMRTRANGDIQYVQSLRSANNDLISGGSALDDSTFLASGRSGSSPSVSAPIYRKFHYNGRLLWEKTIPDGTQGSSASPFLAGLPDGGYLAVSDQTLARLARDSWAPNGIVRTARSAARQAPEFRNDGGAIVATVPKGMEIRIADANGREGHSTRKTTGSGVIQVRFKPKGAFFYQISDSPSP